MSGSWLLVIGVPSHCATFQAELTLALAASWGQNLPSVRNFLSNGQDIGKMIQELERSLQ
jgi:hypothetical protein